MTRFTAIDLGRLPSQPRTALAADAYYAAYMVDLTARLTAVGIPYSVGSLETDTYAITGEAYAYRTALVAQSIDDAIAAVLLPTSYGAYLDLLGATQDPPVQRNVVTPADGATPAVMERDDPFRARIQLAPEALSTCGPEGGYLFFATAVADVVAAAVYGPMSFGGTRSNPFVPLGEVHVPIVSGLGDGTADAGLVAAVQAAVSDKERRPIADLVTASASTILPYSLTIALQVGPGADPGLVQTAATARLQALADLQRRPGGSILDQDLYAAAKVPDANGVPLVGFVDLGAAASGINAVPITPATPGCAYVTPSCTGITVSVQVVDD